MDLTELKTSTLDEIINFARVQTAAPPEQLLPYSLESFKNTINFGTVPIWAQHLYNFKGILRQRMYEIDKGDRPIPRNEWDTLCNLYDNLDKYLQTNLKTEISQEIANGKFKVIISDQWQLFGKLNTYA